MHKVFVEYTIVEEMRGAYLLYMKELQLWERRLELFEGSDQPGLFVEIWDDVPYEEYLRMKSGRLEAAHNNAVPWGIWVQGGLRKLHMWHFAKVPE
ncbi:hypothetical protein [Paenibacillus eucommiae]|uniref:NIPSNAP domain-containing protein n=1 Tax=Paenibacillus eucommiae TaxID=1355755 RepID=A0ABS4IWS0_9BACL|nr:hypothetical protein [Paenibacillus eucommiae]MBP1992046.1 hypothetical protein [Paenibacillus eucommiae]